MNIIIMLARPSDEVGLFTFYIQQLGPQTFPNNPYNPTNAPYRPPQQTFQNTVPFHLAHLGPGILWEFSPNVFLRPEKKAEMLPKISGRAHDAYHSRLYPKSLRRHFWEDSELSSPQQLKAHLQNLRTQRQIEVGGQLEELKGNQMSKKRKAYKLAPSHLTLKIAQLSQQINFGESPQAFPGDINHSSLGQGIAISNRNSCPEQNLRRLKLKDKFKPSKFPRIQTHLRKGLERNRPRQHKSDSQPVKVPRQRWRNPTKQINEVYLEPISSQTRVVESTRAQKFCQLEGLQLKDRPQEYHRDLSCPRRALLRRSRQREFEVSSEKVNWL